MSSQCWSQLLVTSQGDAVEETDAGHNAMIRSHNGWLCRYGKSTIPYEPDESVTVKIDIFNPNA